MTEWADQIIHQVYVVLLDPKVKANKHFQKQNPEWVGKKDCYYVGYSGKTPQERFPAPKDPRKPCSHDLMGQWWRRAEKLAGLEPVKRRGWHSLRRKFASELKDIALADLRDLGGWKDHNTILRCYQRPDEERMRAALASRSQRREMGVI